MIVDPMCPTVAFHRTTIAFHLFVFKRHLLTPARPSHLFVVSCFNKLVNAHFILITHYFSQGKRRICRFLHMSTTAHRFSYHVPVAASQHVIGLVAADLPDCKGLTCEGTQLLHHGHEEAVEEAAQTR